MELVTRGVFSFPFITALAGDVILWDSGSFFVSGATGATGGAMGVAVADSADGVTRVKLYSQLS